MALEFMDGFDHYTAAAQFTRKWNSSATDINPGTAGRFSGSCIRLGSAGANGSIDLSNQATRTVGFAYQAVGVSGTPSPIFALRDAGTAQVDLRIATGVLTATRNGTLLGTASGAALSLSTWYYIEVQATIHASAGTITVRVNGANVIAVTGVNTQNTANAYSNQVWILGGPGGNSYFDDLYVLNASGSVNNNLLGECRIHTTLPSADNTTATGTNKLWTPNAGTTHYTQVDETSPNDDTDYVSSATAGQIDTYQYPDIAPSGAVAAVQTVLCDRKDDVGARTICAEYRSGAGTNYDGASTFSPTTSYLMHRQIYETDPATSAAWTAANINAGEFGVKCVA